MDLMHCFSGTTEQTKIAIDRGYVADERDGASGLYIALDWLF